MIGWAEEFRILALSDSMQRGAWNNFTVIADVDFIVMIDVDIDFIVMFIIVIII